MNKHFETVIIGAGPAGLTAAYHLAKAGRPVCVLEQKKEIGRPVCCGEAISAKALDNSGLFDESYIDSRVRGFRVFFPDDKFFSVETPGYMLNRDRFEQFLAGKSLTHGAEIALSTKAVSMDVNRESASINTAAGRVGANFIIAADGPESLAERPVFSNNFHNLDAVQFKIPKDSFPYNCAGYLGLYYDSLSQYYFWVFEKQNEFNVGGLVADKETLVAFINKRFPSASLKNASFSRGKIPAGWIKKRIFKDSVFLAGDAAGLANPVTFAGLYSSLGSGKSAAEAIIASSPEAYERIIRKKIYTSGSVFNCSKHCYNYPQEVLNFIGDYFEGRDLGSVDFMKFLKLALKTPVIFRYLGPLLEHLLLLKKHKDDLW